MIKFSPKTEEQVSRILKRGLYPFKLLELRPVKSKDGTKDMAYIKILVRGDGKTIEVEDRIPFVEKMEYKWRHFCYSCGLNELYESGVFSGKPMGEFTGTLRLTIEEDQTGNYPPKNKVADYVSREKTMPKASSGVIPETEANDDLNDDIPF